MDPTIAYRLDPDKATAVFTARKTLAKEIEGRCTSAPASTRHKYVCQPVCDRTLMSHREFGSEVRKRLGGEPLVGRIPGGGIHVADHPRNRSRKPSTPRARPYRMR